jgi:hypothetical protein
LNSEDPEDSSIESSSDTLSVVSVGEDQVVAMAAAQAPVFSVNNVIVADERVGGDDDAAYLKGVLSKLLNEKDFIDNVHRGQHILNIADLPEPQKINVLKAAIYCCMIAPIGVARSFEFHVGRPMCIRTETGNPRLSNEEWKDFCRFIKTFLPADQQCPMMLRCKALWPDNNFVGRGRAIVTADLSTGAAPTPLVAR